MKIIFNLRVYFAASFCVILALKAFSQVDLGVEFGLTVTNANIYQIASASHEYARARKNHKINGDGGVVAFLKKADSDLLFSLSRNNVLHLTNFNTRESLGRWPLARWPSEYILPEITDRLSKELAYEPEPEPSLSGLGELQGGCLSSIPLRYGDVDENGSDEIVLFMNQDIIFFSVDQKKVVFQVRWLDERYSDYFDEEGNPVIFDSSNTNLPQFNDPYTEGPLYKGLRAYAKIYLGEFNDNQKKDIIVWYKVYESNMIGGATGFNKVRDTVRHYERNVNSMDEYQEMDTSEIDVRQWLSTNNLTWRKGYPNLTECAGQVDQSILKMIDPLLNDPDVLQ